MHAIKKSQGYFLGAVAVLLFVTGAIKLLSAAGTARILVESDFLLPLTNRHVLLLGGGVDLVLSGFLLMARGRWARLILIACLAAGFLAYQLGSFWHGGQNLFCSLGNFTAWFPISPRTLKPMVLAVYGLPLVGSGLFLAFNAFDALARRPAIPAPSAGPKAHTSEGGA